MTYIACSRQCTSRASGLARTRLSEGLISSAKAAHQQTALATPDAGVALALDPHPPSSRRAVACVGVGPTTASTIPTRGHRK